jgi:hypothetical protein
MAKFQCLATKNVYEFTQEHDIKTMREHKEYAEIIEAPKEEPKPVKKPVATSKE